MTAKNSKSNKICYSLYSMYNYEFKRSLGPNCGNNLQICINVHIWGFFMYLWDENQASAWGQTEYYV